MNGENSPKKPRIVWVDDDEEGYQRQQQALEAESKGRYSFEFEPLEQLIDDERAGVERLFANPPEVLLMDWNEGQIADYYPIIKNIGIGTILLVSANNPAELHLQQAYVDFPELENKTLRKPFTIAQIDALLKQQPSAADDRFLIDILALRYLDAACKIVGKSHGWKLSNDLIPVNFSKEEIAALNSNETVFHTVYSADPSGSGNFGPILIVTTPLPQNVVRDKSTTPADAQYMQRAIVLPPTGVSLEQAGSSAQGIIELVLQSGRFKRGRFYSLSFIPGLKDPALELRIAIPPSISATPLPISREIDKVERADYQKFCHEYNVLDEKEKRKTLIHDLKKDVRPDPFWSQHISNKDIPNRLRIPVFRTPTEIATLQEKAKGRGEEFEANLLAFGGIFVFDKGPGKSVTQEDVAAIDNLFISMLNYFHKARANEEERYDQKLSNYSLHFHKELNKLSSFDAIEKALAARAVHALHHPDLIISEHNLALAVSTNEESQFSASYARHNPRNRSIDVTFETQDDVLNGIRFPLTSNTFVLQQCANNALESTKDIPILIANFKKQYKSIIDQRKTEFLQLAPDRAEKWQNHTSTVKALIALPVLANPRTNAAKLLGVLMVRANKTYTFTQQNVSVLQRLVETALPYIERCEEEQTHRAGLEATIIHETRSHITHAKAKLDRAKTNGDEAERNQALAELEQILNDQIAMCTTIMIWFGRNDEISDNGPTEAHFWEKIDHYGKFRSKEHDEITWEMRYKRELRAEKSFYFERAIKIIIDNAFRHANPNCGRVQCNINTSPNPNRLQLRITNPGQIHHNPTDAGQATPEQAIMINQLPIFEKTVGLNLLKFLCEQVNAPLPNFCNEISDTDPSHAIVALYLHWPLANPD